MSCKSISRFKGKICELTRRNKPGKYSEIIARLNRMLIGWTNYYRYIRSDSKLKELDSWIRRKLRVIKLKQLKRCLVQFTVKYPILKHHIVYHIS
ncbi:MAG: hypothetical protein JEZ07_15575 [Phycisphaerae bacterium]|nr:hypothetical protein [Phycisphaerae bacterium]